MSELSRWISPDILGYIQAQDQHWLLSVFDRYGSRYPTLDEIWSLMDEAWIENGCSPDVMDERIGAFYRHPVWLLNGLFIEQHPQSLENRLQFCDWIAQQSPSRVADYGGGFGGLARMIGEACPAAQVEVIEPHPHSAAIALAERRKNVRYQPALNGQYDILIATDVLEHVPDPLALVAEAAGHLKPGGHFLIANCFHPVVKCHLPSTFHFRWSWDFVMKAIGLKPDLNISYGGTYIKAGPANTALARRVEKRSRFIFKAIEKMPSRVQQRMIKIFMHDLNLN